MTGQPAKSETKRDRAVAARRQHILEAAVRCFLEAGYHQTGVRDIARRAGVSLGNLYNHFPGKHDILAEIATLERAELEPFLALLARPGAADEVLDGFMAAYLRYLAEPEGVVLTLEITCEALRKPDIAEMFMDSRRTLVAAVARVIDRGAAEGRMRAVPDAEEAAHLILELLEGNAYRSLLDGVPMAGLLASQRDFVSAALAVRAG